MLRRTLAAAAFVLALLGHPAVAAAAGLNATVTPSTGLRDGDTVTVAWSGTTPGSTMNVIQCSQPTGAQYCDMPRGRLSIPNPSGAGSVAFVVHGGAIGVGQCDGDHNDCILFVNQDLSYDADKNAFPAIKFAVAAAVTTTTTVAASSPTTAATTTSTTARATVQAAELPRTGGASVGWGLALATLALTAGALLLRIGRHRPVRVPPNDISI